jgi:hypothetical protein
MGRDAGCTPPGSGCLACRPLAVIHRHRRMFRAEHRLYSLARSPGRDHSRMDCIAPRHTHTAMQRIHPGLGRRRGSGARNGGRKSGRVQQPMDGLALATVAHAPGFRWQPARGCWRTRPLEQDHPGQQAWLRWLASATPWFRCSVARLHASPPGLQCNATSATQCNERQRCNESPARPGSSRVNRSLSPRSRYKANPSLRPSSPRLPSPRMLGP